MKKKKVLYILHGLAPGGIESFAINVVDNIDRERVEISFALATEGKQFYEDRVINAGCKVYKTSDLNGLKNIVRHFTKLVELLKKEGPFDVVHSNIDFFNGVNLLAAFIAGVPVRISHAHSTHSVNATSVHATLSTKFYRLLMKSLIRLFATHFLGCSKQANDYMHKWGRVDRRDSKVIFNGINVDKYRMEEHDKKLCRESLGLPRDKICFLTVGRMCEAKNSLFIADVVKELLEIRKDIHFIWVGTGRLEQQIKERIEKYGINEAFSFLGNRTDIPQIIAAADYFLFPSLWEGLPVALIEAQAGGLHCFISDAITEEADIGLCTAISLKKDAKAWAEEICEHMVNKFGKRPVDCRRLKRFDIKETVRTLENIYCSG